jgi:tetratricopeptide (TPR) repeat protein
VGFEGIDLMLFNPLLVSKCVLAMALAVFAVPAVWAAGDDVTTPPAPTPTPRCPDGQIHDKKAGKCVPVKSSSLNDTDRYQAVRELAYAQRYIAASLVLDAMADQLDDRVLTYRGFLMRKTGRFDQALTYYQSAIEKNPSNLLVRSYMGQGFVESGDLAAARRQHEEILARGGQGTWAEVSLRDALASGRTYQY